MYSTCIFCGTRLGTNQVVEEFPVGRRLAFDPEKGRLWALCPGCRQWNLSPVEERWEALEALERLYRDSPKRYSTGQIGLARHDEGLEVVRIGRPTRPEYAAWRYGTELVRRRRRAIVATTLAAAGGALVVGGVGAGVLTAGVLSTANLSLQGRNFYRLVLKTATRVEGPDGSSLRLKERHAQYARLTLEDDEWALSFPYVLDTQEARQHRLQYLLGRWKVGALGPASDPEVTLRGDVAVRAASRILPVLNRAGASNRNVRDATRYMEATGASAHQTFRRAALAPRSQLRGMVSPVRSSRDSVFRLPAPIRLALEMTAHEEEERKALEGELDRLEREWREAEEIAAIADDLLLPDPVRRLLGR